MILRRITKLSYAQVAYAIELRGLGKPVAWENIAAIIGGIHATTVANNVAHAELIGFDAWGKV